MKKALLSAAALAVFLFASCTPLQKNRIVKIPETKAQETGMEKEAKSFYDQGKYIDAIENLRALLKKYPNSPKYWGQLGSAYAQINQFDYSIYAYEQSIQHDPKNIKAMYNLSVVYSEKGDPNKALETAKRALKISPRNPLLQASLGNALIDKEDLKDAKQVYSNIVDAKPDFEIGHFNLGVINYKEKNLDEAEKNYISALTIKPGDVDARQNLSAIYILQERYDEAIDQLKQVIESNPEDDTTLENANFNLGVAYLRLNKFKESLSAFESAIQIEPWDMAAYVNAAIISEQLGLNDKAIKYWQRYDRLLPTNKRKKEIKEKLKKLGASSTTVSNEAAQPAPATDAGGDSGDGEGTLEK